MKHVKKAPALHKFRYYARNLIEYAFVPSALYSKKLDATLARLTDLDEAAIWRRVHYCNKLDQICPTPDKAKKLREISIRAKTSYYYDYRKILRYFDRNQRLAFRFGDVTKVSSYPRIVKTRPIHQPHKNSVLLKLDSVRHFKRITDTLDYREKKDLLVWRGKVKKDHRQDVFREFFNHPLCNLGKTNSFDGDTNQHWDKPLMTIEEQLEYKFILSIEGNDVATNLKWIAQSNSLCFMTRPKFESWFMEGTLEPSKHYVELRDDYSDLPEKIEYYLQRPEEAEEIISNFQNYFQTFLNEEVELLVSLLVVQKYLDMTSQ